MNGRRAIVGLCMLSALLVSAFAAQSASAVTKGTTAFTCVDLKEPTVGGTHSDAHCKTAQTNGRYKHVAINQDTTTTTTVTSEKTNAETNNCTNQILKATIGGVATELSTCVVESTSSGSLTNKLSGSEHYTESTFGLTYTNVQVTKPAGQGCKVFTDNAGSPGEEGVIHTEELKGTTAGQGDSVKIEPKVGEVFATFIISGCSTGALNKTYEVKGSITCKPNGATINCLHSEITTQGNLKLNGTIPAGYEGSTTVTGKHPGLGEVNYTPLSTTTVET